jgi:repressor LexA
MRETDRSVDVTMVPVVGRVTAGIPITAVEQIEEFFPVPSQHTGDGKLFALQVIGESMVEAGIIDGDHVLVRQQPTAQNGDIVVAMTQEGEATVKRFFREQHRIRLQPENSSMEPLYFDTVTILGKVVGVYRFFH